MVYTEMGVNSISGCVERVGRCSSVDRTAVQLGLCKQAAVDGIARARPARAINSTTRLTSLFQGKSGPSVWDRDSGVGDKLKWRCGK